MRLDRYELLTPLAAGGQGSVWRARDPLEPTAPRAVKLVDLVQATPDGIERVRREAHQLAQLEHPSIVPCHGLFEDVKESMLGLVVTYVEGTSSGGLLSDPRFDARKRRLLLQHLAEALAYIHARQIVHRDLKLDNVLIDGRFLAEPERAEHVKLIDFGIALAPTSGRKLTQAGHVVGTPSYMAPETLDASWGGSMNSPAVDVFAFGVIAWRMFLPGHPSGVERARNLADYAIAYRRMKSEPERWLRELDSRPELSWLRQCLALDPQLRLPDGAALVEVLRSSRMPASEEELAATQVAAQGYSPPAASPGFVLPAASGHAGSPAAPTPTSAPTVYSPELVPQGKAAEPARGNRFAIGMALGLLAAVIFGVVAVVGVSGAALFAYTDRASTDSSLPKATCAPGSALPASREVTLWVGPVELMDGGDKRNLKENEAVCLSNLRTGARSCARGNGWSPTIKVRVGDLLSTGAGVLVQYEHGGSAETLASRSDLGVSAVTCPESGWLMGLAPNSRLQLLPVFPR